MTEAEREALLERAGIMEYDAGLDRREATLMAFALYYPTDYQYMVETGSTYQDGETFIYEYLEGILKASQPYRRGLEALQHYTVQGIKLMPCIMDGSRYRPIVKKENWMRTATTDIETIRHYIRGGELWTGKDPEGGDMRQSINLFRFIPKEYGFIGIDIDRGHLNGVDGFKNFYKWLEDAGIYKPQLPSYLQDFSQFPCYTATPSGGVHLLFKCTELETRNALDVLEAENTLTDKLTDSVEVFYNKPLTAAGSTKQNGEYILYGELTAAIELDPILLRRLKKTKKPKTIKPISQRAIADRPINYPQQFSKTDLELYKHRLVEYLHTKGYAQNQGEFIPCLCHADGETPNMFINEDYLYCYACKERLDIFGTARILAGIGQNKKDFPKVIAEVKRALGV